MKKHTYFIAVTAALAIIAGCLGSLENYTKEPCTQMPNDYVMLALKDNCVSCHKKDFNTKEDVCVHKTRIVDSVTKNRMPKMGKLYPHYKKTLVEWK